MKIAIQQANFIPWYAYFHIMSKVDKFFIFDNVMLGDRSFVNRNFIYTNKKKKWLTLPVEKKYKRKQLKDIEIRSIELKKIKNFLLGSFGDKKKNKIIENIFETKKFKLVDLNVLLLKKICKLFEIKCEIFKTSKFEPKNSLNSSEYVKKIMLKSECTEYFNFQKGIDLGLSPYNDKSFFKENKIKLFKQNVEKIIDTKEDTFLNESIIKLILHFSDAEVSMNSIFEKYSHYISYERIF